MRCSDCRFWREGQDHAQGWCHRHAPRPVVTWPEEAAVVDTFFPPMPASEGCGEAQPVKLRQTVYIAHLEYAESPGADMWEVSEVSFTEENAVGDLYQAAQSFAANHRTGFVIVVPAASGEGVTWFRTTEHKTLEEIEEDSCDWDAWGTVVEREVIP